MDGHDLAVDSLSDGIRDAVGTVTYDSSQSFLDGASHFLQWFEIRVDNSVVPVFEEVLRLFGILMMPQISKHLFARPGFAGFQLLRVGRIESLPLRLTQVLLSRQP